MTNFEKAENLVSDHDKIQEHLHKMTGNILTRKNKVQVDRISILKYLSQNSADYRIKTQGEIYRSLIIELGIGKFLILEVLDDILNFFFNFEKIHKY
jgi:hypothetical protein